MLLKEKHAPLFLNEFIINKEISLKLNNLLKYGLSNIEFYGPQGSGKFILANSIINTIYNKKVLTKFNTFKVNLINSKDITITTSDVHFEIVLDKYNITNKQYIMKLLEMLTNSDDVNSVCNYKIIIIRNIIKY